MSEELTPADKALVPLTKRTVDFYGDPITGVLVHLGPSPATWYVPLRPLCAYLKLSWPGQFERTRRDDVFGPELISVRMTRTEKSGRGQGGRVILCLPLEFLPGWLTGIETGRIKDDTLAAKITRYRRECFRVLWQAFEAQVLPQIIPDDPRLQDLAAQIDQLAGTLAFLREHLADIAAAASTIAVVSRRLDQAVNLLEALTHQQQALHTRQDATEAAVERIDERTAHLTPAHKRQVQLFIDQMVHSTKALPQPLSYARIYGRLKTRFAVSTYAEVPDDAFDALLAYLRDELRLATNGEAPEQRQLF